MQEVDEKAAGLAGLARELLPQLNSLNQSHLHHFQLNEETGFPKVMKRMRMIRVLGIQMMMIRIFLMTTLFTALQALKTIVRTQVPHRTVFSKKVPLLHQCRPLVTLPPLDAVQGLE